jgi:hypothetical protein
MSKDGLQSEHRCNGIPEKMKALQYGARYHGNIKTDLFRYSAPEKFAVVQIDVPEIGNDDVLVSQQIDEMDILNMLTACRSRSLHAECAGQYVSFGRNVIS